MKRPTLSTADFRDRIARICGFDPLAPNKAKTHPALLRKPGDRGYFKTQTKPTEGAKRQ